MKKQLALILALGLLLSGCSKADTQEVTTVTSAEETTVLENEDTETEIFETEPIETTTEETTAVTAGENQVVIGGQVYDIDTEELYLIAQNLTADDADALSQMTNLLRLELNYFTNDDVENVSEALSGIEDFSDITLVLSEAYVSDLSFLNNLPNLKTLRVIFSGIKDYSTLENIPTLEKLAVRSSSINGYSQFSGLTNITELDLGEGSADDLSPLSGLTNLKKLNLDHSTLGDLTPLNSLTSLEELDISYTNVEDISPLSSMTWLDSVYLHDNSVTDISPLTFTRLGCISIDYDSADYIETLNKMKCLNTLIIIFTGTSDVLSLSSLTGLHNLYIFYGPDVNEEDIEALRQALPDCEISTEYSEWLKVRGEDE